MDNVLKNDIIIKEVNVDLNYNYFNKGHGTHTFTKIQTIADIKARFPELGFYNTYSLYLQSLRLAKGTDFNLDTLVNLQNLQNEGWDIKLGTIGIDLVESIKHQDKESGQLSTYFDISQTTLPREAYKSYKERKFTVTDEFLLSLYNKYQQNSGFSLSHASEEKIDYDNKTLYFSVENDPNKTLKNFIAITSLHSLLNTKEKYNKSIVNEKNIKSAKYYRTVLANAFYKQFPKIESEKLSTDEQNSFQWGDYTSRMQKIKYILKSIETLSQTLDLKNVFNSSYEKQLEDNKKKSEKFKTQNNNVGDNFQEIISKLKDRCKNEADIVSVAEHYSIEMKKSGADFQALCPSRDHDEKTPSFTISPSKNICKCFGCGFGGNPYKFVAAMENLDPMADLPKIVIKLSQIIGINTSYEDIIAQAKGDTTPTKKATIEDPKLQNYNEKPPQVPKTFEQISDSKVIKIEELTKHPRAIEYLNSRGLYKFPPELKYLVGQKPKDDGTSFVHSGVGYINRTGGADIRHAKKVEKKQTKSYSFGDKDFILLNKENLQENKLTRLSISESSWDYTAAYNQPSLKQELDSAVNIIANGSNSTIDNIIDYINEHKCDDTEIIFLTQPDEPGLKLKEIISIKTGITCYTSFKYTDEEEVMKKDANDLHQDNVDLKSRLTEGILCLQ